MPCVDVPSSKRRYANMKILLHTPIHILIQAAGANSVIANGIRTYTPELQDNKSLY